MGNIFAFLTASVVHTDGREEHGWVDPRWSRTELVEHRNDVTPLINLSDDAEELAEYVRDALEENLGPYEDNGDGSFYGQDSTQDVETGANWSYALHFKRKFLGPDGWTEVPWHPVTDGGITL